MLKEETIQVNKMATYAEQQIELKLSSVKRTSRNDVYELKEKIEVKDHYPLKTKKTTFCYV